MFLSFLHFRTRSKSEKKKSSSVVLRTTAADVRKVDGFFFCRFRVSAVEKSSAARYRGAHALGTRARCEWADEFSPRRACSTRRRDNATATHPDTRRPNPHALRGSSWPRIVSPRPDRRRDPRLYAVLHRPFRPRARALAFAVTLYSRRPRVSPTGFSAGPSIPSADPRPDSPF